MGKLDAKWGKSKMTSRRNRDISGAGLANQPQGIDLQGKFAPEDETAFGAAEPDSLEKRMGDGASRLAKVPVHG
jgi:hypothetical protein